MSKSFGHYQSIKFFCLLRKTTPPPKKNFIMEKVSHLTGKFTKCEKNSVACGSGQLIFLFFYKSVCFFLNPKKSNDIKNQLSAIYSFREFILGGFGLLLMFQKNIFCQNSCFENSLPDKGEGNVWAYREKFNIDFLAQNFSWPVHMYRKSPKKFERKFQCKNFHSRPLFLEIPKIRTSPNNNF